MTPEKTRLGQDAKADASLLPLETDFKVAGSIWVVRTNSLSIVRSIEQTFEALDDRNVLPDLSLSFFVNYDLSDKRPWPKPHFRGLNHLVYASYSSGNTLLINLLDRSVVGQISPDMAQDTEYWRYVLLPVLLGTCSAAIGITPLHCACLVKDGRGLLLGGMSGAGKSTLALSLALKGFSFLSDDWTYFNSSDCEAVAYGIPTVIKLLPDTVKYFPQLRTLEPHISLNGELAFEVDPVRWFGVTKSAHCPVESIVFIERGNTNDAHLFEPISSDEAFSRFLIDLETLPACLSPMRKGQLQTVKNVVNRECLLLRHARSPESVAEQIAKFYEERVGEVSMQDAGLESSR
jgi:hypothetical protein